MYEEREAELDREDDLGAREEERMWLGRVPPFINNRHSVTRVGKSRAKHSIRVTWS